MRHLIWKDATSYSQGQRGKKPQTAWETDLDGVRIWVSCGHLDHPGRWVMNCRPINIIKRDIGGTNLTSEQARDRAVMTVYSEAKAMQRMAEGIADSAFAVVPLSSTGDGDET